MNTITITLLICMAFSAIYFVMHQNTNSSINAALSQTINFRPPMDKFDKFSDPRNQYDQPIESQTKPLIRLMNNPSKDDLLPNGTMSFVADLNPMDELLSIFSTFEAEETFYRTLLEQYTGETTSSNRLIVGDTTWAVLKTHRKDFTQISFIDVTLQLELLERLMYTFVFVAFLMIIFTFFISNYLTNISIKPIKDAFEKQNQFISDASHELKTPLTVINSNVDVLLNDYRDTPSEKWLSYIQTEVARMKQLTENLLYLSKFDHADYDILFAPVNISEIAEHLLIGIEVMAFEKNLKLNYSVDDKLILNGNPEQLSQVIMILLDNAMKYTSSDGHIDFTITKNTSHIIIEIINDSQGISPENISKLFDRFYKVDISRHNVSNGYGLGLSIAQSIVKKHKGKISCQSNFGKNVTFIVKLPIH